MAKPAADLRSNRAAVQATNEDAPASKLSCVQKGYMKDDYVHLFVKRPVRRSPIINRGYFARYAALRKLLYQFLDCGIDSNEKENSKKQILSLGAGFDTTFFQMQPMNAFDTSDQLLVSKYASHLQPISYAWSHLVFCWLALCRWLFSPNRSNHFLVD